LLDDSTYREVRKELLIALRASNEQSLPSQLDFSLSDITDKHKPIKRMLPKEDPNNEEEPEVWITPEPIETGTQKQFKTSVCLLHPSHFSFNDFKAAVNRLPAPLHDLVKYCYAEKYKWLNVELLSKSLWKSFLLNPRYNVKKIRAAKVKRLKGMVFLAAQNWQSIVTNNKPAYTPDAVIRMLGVSKSNWRRDWLPFWRLFMDQIEELDKAAIYEIHQQTGDRRKKERTGGDSAAA
jgi:hypothetical protein